MLQNKIQSESKKKAGLQFHWMLQNTEEKKGWSVSVCNIHLWAPCTASYCNAHCYAICLSSLALGFGNNLKAGEQ